MARVADMAKLSGDRLHEAPVLEPDTVRPGPPVPPLTTRAVIEAEREALATCLAELATQSGLLGWLTPGDFSRPEHATTWAAFGALAKAGTPSTM